MAQSTSECMKKAFLHCDGVSSGAYIIYHYHHEVYYYFVFFGLGQLAGLVSGIFLHLTL